MRRLKEMKITPPWDMVTCNKTASLHVYLAAINSKGEYILSRGLSGLKIVFKNMTEQVESGKLKRTIKFNSTSPRNYTYHITFDHVTKERFENRTRLKRFSETGELRNSLFLYGKQFSSYGRVVCLTNGAMVIAVYKKQIYLRSPVIEQ